MKGGERDLTSSSSSEWWPVGVVTSSSSSVVQVEQLVVPTPRPRLHDLLGLY
jgi:hypothetical protein